MDLVTLGELISSAIGLIGGTAAVVAWIFNRGGDAAKQQAVINALTAEVDTLTDLVKALRKEFDEADGFEELRRDLDAAEIRLGKEIDQKTDQVHSRVNKAAGEAISRTQATLELVALLRTDIAVMKSGAQKMTDDQTQHEENVAELLRVAAGSTERFKYLEQAQTRLEAEVGTLNREVATLKGRRG